MNHYALILAGGSGTRFWPLSRNKQPKQLLQLLGEDTLLRQAIDRLNGLVPKENIFILTAAIQEEEVRKQAQDIPAGNIIAEPARRDTAPAIALGIGLIAAKDPSAAMLVIPSDQLISNEGAFRSLMQDAMTHASCHDALITVGIKPTWPCPSYGYIERGDQVPCEGSHPCYQVLKFREKPSIETAREYLTQGGFSWNAGMFVWSIPTVRAQLEKHCPELAEFITTLAQAPDTNEVVQHNFPTLTPISIDFALMEKADRVLNFEATFDWDDVGSWISVATYLAQYGSNNACNTSVTVQDASENIVFVSGKDKHVALLGVDSLIVVDTPDALLVADKSKADDIKKIVEQLPNHLL